MEIILEEPNFFQKNDLYNFLKSNQIGKLMLNKYKKGIEINFSVLAELLLREEMKRDPINFRYNHFFK